MAENLDKLFDEAEDLDAQFDAADGGTGGASPNPGFISDDEHLFDQAVDNNFSFEEPEYEPVVQSGPTQAEAAGRGLVSGATGGFDSEMGGAFQAHMQMGSAVSDAIYPDEVLEWARSHGIGSEPIRDADGSVTSPLDVYRGGRDSNQREFDELEKAFPKTVFGTQIAGGFLNPVARGAGPLASGATAGLGFSDADLTSGDPVEVGNAAADATIGAVAGKSLHTLASVAGSKFANTSVGQSVINKFDDWVNKPASQFGEWADNQLGRIATQAARNIDSNYAKALGELGPPQAEVNRAIRDLKDPNFAGRTKLAQDPTLKKKMSEIVREQAPKKAQIVREFEPAPAPKVPTEDDVFNEINRLVDKDLGMTGKNLRRVGWAYAEHLPGGVGDFLKFNRKLYEKASKNLGQSGTLMKLFRKAQRVSTVDQGALGRYMNNILNSADPAVTDYVLSQTDPAWRELKREIELAPGPEGTFSPDDNE